MIQKLLELLYPSTCIFCGKICQEGICPECRTKVRTIREPRCKKCGKPIRRAEEEYCYDCQKRKFHYEQGRSLWLHKAPVKESVYRFKYKNRRVYGEVYAKEMAEAFGELLRLREIDLIIPVPLHKRKLKSRGFNQAAVLARKLGELTGIPVNTELVVRRKYTTPQKEFGHNERRKNLKDAFAVTKKQMDAAHILIIDDIYTTGSTIDSIAEVLEKSGVTKTYFLTISIGQGF